MPPAVRPKGTIESFTPASGGVPFVVTARWKLTEGSLTDVKKVEWLLDGSVVATNIPSDPDHHYKVETAGDHRIDLRIHDALGLADQTGVPRIIHAVSAPAAPSVVVPVTTPTDPPPVPLTGPAFRGELRASGVNIVGDSGIVKVRGVTAFTALQLFAENKLAPLKDYADWTRSIGAFAWRTFCMWTVTGFTIAGHETLLRDFADFCLSEGLHVWPVLFCDQVAGSSVLLSPAQQDAYFKACVAGLAGRRNVIGEICNEDWKNGEVARRFAPPASFALFTRSAFQDGKAPTEPGPLLRHTTEHPPRSWDWPRKAKNLYETAVTGLGATAPATKIPALAGEPIGINESAVSGRRTNDPKACADFYAVLELMSAGGVLHGDMSNLMTCQRPGPVAQRCADAVRAVWQCGIPADLAGAGTYTRGGLSTCPLKHSDRYDESGTEVDPAGALRTFGLIKGNSATCVVVQAGSKWKADADHGWRIVRQYGPHGQLIECAR